MNFSNERTRLYQWMRRQLLGSGSILDKDDTETAITGMLPSERFQCGVLFPVSSEDLKDNFEVPALGQGSDGIESDEESAIHRQVRYVPPSSVGFSFYIEGADPRLEIRVWGVIYECQGGSGTTGHQVWIRHPLGTVDEHLLEADSPPINENYPVCNERKVFQIDSDKARGLVQILWRRFGSGWVVTVSLCNNQKFKPLEDTDKARQWQKAKEESTLFEVELECSVLSGTIGDYPRTDPSLLTEEDQELELQYRHRRIYGIGHGAAVDWGSESSNGSITKIWADFLPTVEVPQVTADTGNDKEQALDLQYLARIAEEPEAVIQSLSDFIDSYAQWIAGQEQSAEVLSDHQGAAHRILGRASQALNRMRVGIERLRNDGEARLAFSIANRAMLLQMQQSRRVGKQEPRPPRWRAFQLGFVLSTLASSINEDAIDRDLVDLIWFPTGGGKTEAYLALIAFVVAWRRLHFPQTGAGTTALMRYTLRLLTAQQFERANRLIFALELIRKSDPKLGLGNAPFSIGIWVGGSTSPNTFRDAIKIVAAGAARKIAPRKLLVTHCPWCGASFVAPKNYRATASSFNFQCHNADCSFSVAKGYDALPCNVVDEALFQNPPTLLIGTIDKFARLAWDARTSAFFGRNGDRPPELIIQDELHLIAGPLGSVAGIYEAALDTVIQSKGVRPKYIASTATIRNAADQVRRLYARDTAIFPPPGLSADDAYFARTIPTDQRPGRLYVGYLAPKRARSEAIAPLAAGLLAAPKALFEEQENRDDLLDAWWTLVSYHSSLKGIGNAYSAIDKDARRYMEVYLQSTPQVVAISPFRLDSTRRRIQQLSSIVDAETNYQTFARLTKTWQDDDRLDVLVSTNMISVGVDIPRLATMIINGQPLTTAEYIQSSSRVGRGDVPGIIFTNYYRDQARSLSHYESFRAYHESFYRYVEPTSVTPFSYPCRQRALHAALVIAMRHGAGLLSEDAVKDFDPSAERIAKVIALLERRCRAADIERGDATAAHLESLQREWLNFVEDNKNVIAIRYSESDKSLNSERLLYDFDAQIKGVWPTLQSMRNVEHTVLVKLL
jgi:Helicase conserved C-terminal domain